MPLSTSPCSKQSGQIRGQRKRLSWVKAYRIIIDGNRLPSGERFHERLAKAETDCVDKGKPG